MFNILVDMLPRDYEGYLINYQYFTGILLIECLKDREKIFENNRNGNLEKIYTAFNILYGNGIPDLEKALEGLDWFLNCGEPHGSKSAGKEYFSFEQDSRYIYSAFRVKYNINLATEKDLHWFEFIYLFNDLSKTAFREIVNIRSMTSKDMKGYSKEMKSRIMEEKRKFALKKDNIEKLSTEEQDKVDEFYKMIGK